MMSKKTAKTIMAFLTAMTMTAGAMGVTAYAEEANTVISQQTETSASKKAIEEKRADMIEYLMSNEISKEVAEEVADCYAIGLSERIRLGYAPADGNENEATVNYYKDNCRNVGQTKMELLGIGLSNTSEVQKFLEQNNFDNEKGIRLKADYVTGGLLNLQGIEMIPDDYEDTEQSFSDYAPYDVEYTEYTEYDGVVESGLEYHMNPETGVLFIDGNGVLTWDDSMALQQSFADEYVRYIVYGKNVKHSNYSHDSHIQRHMNDGYNRYIFEMSAYVMPIKLLAYKGTPTEETYNEAIAYHESHGETDVRNTFYIGLIDDDVDPYDLLSGKADINKYISTSESKTLMPKAGVTLQGDADVNNEVGLSDVITVAKYNLNNELYPLANETAFANADMNSDGEVNGVDTSALIEDQLGKK